MASEARPLEILFFPFMAPGHMIPILDMAGLFASRGGVKATVVTTPGNATLVQPAVDRANQSGAARMRLLLIPFPCAEAGLPDGCENAVSVPPGLGMKFVTSTELLRRPFEQLIEGHLPDCIISDAFFPWTADVAQGFGIPRLVFDGTSFFSNCVFHSLLYLIPKAEDCPPEGNASFVMPGLPHRIEMLRTQVPDFGRTPEVAEFLHALEVSELKSFGMVLNSFYELEPEYADHYKNTLGRRAWQVGPLSLCNRDMPDGGMIRGGESAIAVDDCLNWLDAKKPNSVVYVSFGSISRFTDAQLREIALGLEASDHPFVWVVRDPGGAAVREPKWLPEGFLDRMEEKNTGLLIRGWAPQLLILNHGAVGAFVSHCGWNSCLEAIAAGVPLVTWPLAAEQFYNEKQVTELLGVGEPVGVGVWTREAEERELVGAQKLRQTVARVMGGGEAAEGTRRRARELAGMARRAVGEGGSSHADMDRLISELLRDRREGPGADAVNKHDLSCPTRTGQQKE